MTVEGSHETPQGPPAPPATPATPAGRVGMGSQQLRVLLLVVVIAAVGVGAWLAFFHSSKHHKHNLTTAIGPRSLSVDGLRAEAATIGTPIYWIGPKRGYRYEFTRTTKDRLYIRYLPKGVGAGKKEGQLLIVATYPWYKPYKALHKASKGRGVTGPDGSFIIPARPGDTKSVLVAYPKAAFEIEVYDPTPGRAATIAEQGKLTTVG